MHFVGDTHHAHVYIESSPVYNCERVWALANHTDAGGDSRGVDALNEAGN